MRPTVPVGRCALVPTGSSTASVPSIVSETDGVVVPMPTLLVLVSTNKSFVSTVRAPARVVVAKHGIPETDRSFGKGSRGAGGQGRYYLSFEICQLAFVVRQ